MADARVVHPYNKYNLHDSLIVHTGIQKKRLSKIESLKGWRVQDSNLRPLGYEPNELPLLQPAV